MSLRTLHPLATISTVYIPGGGCLPLVRTGVGCLPPVNRITDRFKNSTLPQLRYRVEVQWVDCVRNVIFVYDRYILFIFAR